MARRATRYRRKKLSQQKTLTAGDDSTKESIEEPIRQSMKESIKSMDEIHGPLSNLVLESIHDQSKS